MFQTDSPWRNRTTLCIWGILDAAPVHAAGKHFIMSAYGNSSTRRPAPTPGHFRTDRISIGAHYKMLSCGVNGDRKSTRLNSRHTIKPYALLRLKKKTL